MHQNNTMWKLFKPLFKTCKQNKESITSQTNCCNVNTDFQAKSLLLQYNCGIRNQHQQTGHITMREILFEKECLPALCGAPSDYVIKFNRNLALGRYMNR